MSLINRAADFARKAHEGQFRRGGIEPYFSHPEAVARVVARYLPGNEEAIAIAYLHDVIEDCGVRSWELDEQFGVQIGSGVVFLSKIPGESLGHYREGLAGAPSIVASVKCADIIHNAGNVADVDPSFALRWLPEKMIDLIFLEHADPAIYKEAGRVVALAIQKAAALADLNIN